MTIRLIEGSLTLVILNPSYVTLRNQDHVNLIFLYSTAVGIRGKDGVVLGVEKLITSKLHEASSNKRIFTVDRHIGIVSPSHFSYIMMLCWLYL